MSTDREAIAQRITSELHRETGQFGSTLAAALGLPKKEVNSVLYDDKRFIRSAHTKPKWYLAGQEVEAVPDDEGGSAPRPAMSSRTEILETFDADDDFGQPDPERMAHFVINQPEERIPYVAPQPDPSNPLGLYQWQQEALAAWHANNDQGIIDAVTGAGKTRLAIAAISEQFAAGGVSVILVPGIVLLHQWVDIIHQLVPGARVGRVGDGMDDNLDRYDILVAVLASARNRVFFLAPDTSGLLVADECHRAASDKNQDALDPRFKKRLGLSATHERMDDAHQTVLLPYFHKVVFSLGYPRAIRDGVITNVRVAFVGVDFTEEELATYHDLMNKLRSARRKLIREWGCRPKPFSLFLDDVLRLMRNGPARGGILANNWMSMWRQKKDLLAETPAKLNAIKAFIPVFEDADRSLVFTQSIASATTLCEVLEDREVAVKMHHSEISTSERAEIMDGFSDGSISVLVTVQTLEEGVDVPDADLAVIVASSKQRRQMIQRMGRIMRRKADGRDARFLLLYVKGTDEDPVMGAHEMFIDELLEVAREANLFEIDDIEGLRSFLDPHRV